MEAREMIDGVCCDLCIKYVNIDCPIENADRWSKYDYCSHFRNADSKSIPEVLEELKK